MMKQIYGISYTTTLSFNGIPDIDTRVHGELRTFYTSRELAEKAITEQKKSMRKIFEQYGKAGYEYMQDVKIREEEFSISVEYNDTQQIIKGGRDVCLRKTYTKGTYSLEIVEKNLINEEDS